MKETRKENQKVRKIPPRDQDQGRMIEVVVITQGRLIPTQSRVQIVEAGQDHLTNVAQDQDLPSERENLTAGCTRTGSHLIYQNDTDHSLHCLMHRPTGEIKEATLLAMMTGSRRLGLVTEITVTVAGVVAGPVTFRVTEEGGATTGGTTACSQTSLTDVERRGRG